MCHLSERAVLGNLERDGHGKGAVCDSLLYDEESGHNSRENEYEQLQTTF